MNKSIALDFEYGLNTYIKNSNQHEAKAEVESCIAAIVKYTKFKLEAHNFNVVLTQPLEGRSRLRSRTRCLESLPLDLLLSIRVADSSNSKVRGYHCFYWCDSLMSKKLADLWHIQSQRYFSHPCRGIRASSPGEWTNFYMLRVPAQFETAAIVVVVGYATNINDILLLKSDEFRQKCADVFLETVKAYYQELVDSKL